MHFILEQIARMVCLRGSGVLERVINQASYMAVAARLIILL